MMEYLHKIFVDHPLLVSLVLFFGPPIVGLFFIREKKARPESRPWTDAETRELLESLAAGIPMEVTARILRRNLVDLVRRIESLRLFRQKA